MVNILLTPFPIVHDAAEPTAHRVKIQMVWPRNGAIFYFIFSMFHNGNPIRTFIPNTQTHTHTPHVHVVLDGVCTRTRSHVCIYMCVCVVWACLPQQWQHPQCRTVTFWQFKQSAYVRCNHIVHLPLVWHIEVEHSEIHHFILAFIKNQQLVDVLSGCYHLVDDIFAGAQRIDHCHRMT